MSDTIDYYFSLASPWAYLGHAPFMAMRERHGLTVNFKPVVLPKVFEQTGGLVLPKRHPVRQRYRLVEMQRWRDRRGVPLTIHPKFWPFDFQFADRTVLATAMTGHDPADYLGLCFAGVWAHDLNLADKSVLEGLLRRAGLDAAAILAAADSAPVIAAYDRHVEDAVAADVIGSPCYVRKGEVFWGQDRLDLLEDAIASGRGGYAPV
jgi:2-hydroxychromene-2-carboxylate isomerase